MKRVLTLLLCGVLFCGSTSVTTFAADLNDVVAENQLEGQSQENSEAANTGGTTGEAVNNSSNSGTMTREESQEYLDMLNEASKIQAPNETVKKVNQGLSKVVSMLVNVMSYAITVGLTLRVILDLCFITLPFTRTFLGNGYAGNGAVGNDMQQGMQPGMGGMGMNGMGGMGMNRMGMGGMGMNRMGMGMNGMGGMGMQPGGQGMGMQPSATGRFQWVSTAALNAVAAEQVPTPDGRARSAIKLYVSDMAIVLVAVPILIVLATSGVLVQIGLLIGDAIASGISALGGMI